MIIILKSPQLPYVLLLGYQLKENKNATLYCLFKYIDGATECMKRKTVVLEMDSCDKQKEYNRKLERKYIHVFHVCLMTNKDSEIPAEVALSSDRSCTKATQFIPVHRYRPQTKLDISICVQTPVFKKETT